MIVAALYGQDHVDITVLHLVLSIVSEDSHIINLLLGNGLGIFQVQAIQVNVLICIVCLVHFIEDLPCDVIVNLLLHFLVLLISDFLFIILFTVLLIFIVDFALQVLANFIILLDDIASFLSKHLLNSRMFLLGCTIRRYEPCAQHMLFTNSQLLVKFN